MKEIIVKYNIKFIEKVTNSSKKYYNQEIKISDNCTLSELLENLEKKYAPGMGYTFLITNLNQILWGKYNFKMLDDDRNELDYYKMKLRKLNMYNNVTENKLQIEIISGIGGEVGRIKKIVFFFHMNEKDIHRNTPHIHCKHAGEEIRVNLNTLQIMDKREFKSKSNTKLALKAIKCNQEGLLKYWNDVVINGEKGVKYKMRMVLE